MRKAEKAHLILRRLEELYPNPPIPLEHRDAFTLLVAVVLSAQCTDAMVNRVTPRLFAMAPDVVSMAKCNSEEVRKIIAPCGLSPTKARHIVALSQQIVAVHGGHVPSTFAELEALPGVGHKTASVVMSQAFGHIAFPVDTHIHRLAARWGLSDGSSVEKTEADLKKIFPQESWNRLHLQMIYYGREHCPARSHDPSICELCSYFAPKSRHKGIK
jgi:endonuclease-3